MAGRPLSTRRHERLQLGDHALVPVVCITDLVEEAGWRFLSHMSVSKPRLSRQFVVLDSDHSSLVHIERIPPPNQPGKPHEPCSILQSWTHGILISKSLYRIFRFVHSDPKPSSRSRNEVTPVKSYVCHDDSSRRSSNVP